MSSTTDLLIYVRYDEDDAMARVNAWCESNDGRQQQFAKLNTDAAGGNKFFGGDVWAMCGNYFPAWELAAVLHTFDWRDPEYVVLIVQFEYAEQASVFRPTDPVKATVVIDGETAPGRAIECRER